MPGFCGWLLVVGVFRVDCRSSYTSRNILFTHSCCASRIRPIPWGRYKKMASTGLSVHTPITPNQMESQTRELCDSLSKHSPEDTQALFGDLHKMATAY